MRRSRACFSTSSESEKEEERRKTIQTFLGPPQRITLFFGTAFVLHRPMKKSHIILQVHSFTLSHLKGEKMCTFSFWDFFGLIFIFTALFPPPARTSQSTKYITSLSYHLRENRINQSATTKQKQHIRYAINKIIARTFVEAEETIKLVEKKNFFFPFAT